MREQWIANFSPDSTARAILRSWVEKIEMLGLEPTALGVRQFLIDIRDQSGLEMIDLIELRQYARFCQGGALTEKRLQIYANLEEALGRLIADFGPTI